MAGPAQTAVAPRVLLVEDDTSIRRFVRIALEELPIELVEAQTLAQARAAVAAAPVRLVVCDLMLPDGSGVDLLRELAGERGDRLLPRLVAFSAGLSAERREQLEALGVDELLAKPVALDELEACVLRALPPFGGDEPAPAGVAPPPATADPVAVYFAGDAALYAAYRAACLPQFTRDVAAGDAALADGDLGALRRLAHSLKSVLLTLGHEADSAGARSVEQAAADGDLAAAVAGWARLRAALLALAATS